MKKYLTIPLLIYSSFVSAKAIIQPGVVINPPIENKVLCTKYYSSRVRPSSYITNKIKKAKFNEEKPAGRIKDYELDHVVPISLGGALKDPKNLMLDPWPRARIKDKLERKLLTLVCSGRVDLNEAQKTMMGYYQK